MLLAAQTDRWDKLLKQFKSNYGHDAQFVSRSPGRVNIIGEHIDYSLYSVLPMAITADALLAVSTQIDESASTIWTPGSFGVIEKRSMETTSDPRGMEVLMDGTVPAGGGLSSSAAFTTASALAVMFANGEKSVDKTQLTELAIVSERAVGVNSGGMDQSASVFSIRGSALYVSFNPTLTAKPVHFPKTNPELTFVIAQSFVAADKHVTGPPIFMLLSTNLKDPLPSDSGPLGVSLYGFHSRYFVNSTVPLEEQLSELIDLTKKTFTKEEGYTREEIASVINLTVPELNERFTSTFPIRAEHFKLRQRTLHVFTEALRVLKFMKVLEHPESYLNADGGDSTETFNRKLGDLMNETQTSCREDFDCSCPELDELCEIAKKAGSYGSRLTGAGWGGCSVHLVPANKVNTVREAWDREYYSKKNLSKEQREAAVVVSKPGSGSAIFVVEGGNVA
ncbi:hypothetical protein DID88_003495 [Monilinia fructigena]|uniref:Galactokinase n=1 Tax=Monilinia fructigena TaxID=38457 RepID=A0A395IUA8_9HELO|nr:hypothetical protein DID88_003495 [Monilinia fructigena]